MIHRMVPAMSCPAKAMQRFVFAVGLALALVATGVVTGSVSALAKTPSQAPRVQEVVSPGGIRAWLIRDRLNPIISLRLRFAGGTTQDPVGKEGASKMVSYLLDEGAGDMTGLAFQRRIEDLSISLNFRAHRDGFSVSLKTLRRNRDEAFRLMGLALTKPRFDKAAVARVRRQMLSAYDARVKRPANMASRMFFRTIFGTHPYSRPQNGTATSLKAITIADLKARVARFGRDRMLIGVVGDISPAELGALLDKTLGSLPAKATLKKLSFVTPKLSGGVAVRHFDVPQSTIYFSQQGLARGDKDFYAAYILNHILGGGSFTSRLFNEVREKRGLAYSIATYLNSYEFSYLWVGSVSTRNDGAAQSIALIRKEWAQMARDGVTEKELAAAKQFLIGSYPLQFTNTASIASFLVSLQLDKLPIDYFQKRNKLMESVTLKDVNRVARRLLSPKNLTFFVVGKPKGL